MRSRLVWCASLAAVLAAMEGADPARACLLATFHDTQETRLGDIPHVARRYLTATSNEEVTADQIRDCPPAVAALIQDTVAEHEQATSPEAAVAHDADKLECLLQALEYRSAGVVNVQDWIDSSRAALQTTSAIAIADAATGLSGLEWRRG